MSCLPTGTSFLNNNLNDLKYFFEKGSRFYPQDSFMGKLENLGRYITVIPAHAITAIVFAPIAVVYDFAIFLLSELFETISFFMCYENAYMVYPSDIFFLSSLRDIDYMMQHAVASVFPWIVYADMA